MSNASFSMKASIDIISVKISLIKLLSSFVNKDYAPLSFSEGLEIDFKSSNLKYFILLSNGNCRTNSGYDLERFGKLMDMKPSDYNISKQMTYTGNNPMEYACYVLNNKGVVFAYVWR